MIDEACACPSYASTRRNFLRNVTLASTGTMAATMFGDTFRQTAFGATDSNVVVVLSLRGGADFLSLVVPHAESMYYDRRPNISVPKATLKCADEKFGLHPAFQPLVPLWKQAGPSGVGMGVVLATGMAVPNRSHFDAIEAIEDAAPGSDTRTGWINNLVGLQGLSDPLEAVSVGSGMMPTSMVGSQPTLAATSTDAIDLAGGSGPGAAALRRKALNQIWGQANGTLALGARSSLSTTERLAATLSTGYTPSNGANYPDDSLGHALSDTARLIKAQVGVKVVTVDHGGWDMHSNIGNLSATGDLCINGMATRLANALAAFFRDLGAGGARVTLVTVTEFGRRVTKNGAGGLDHGWAGSTLVVGGGVNGGQYHGKWPGLSDANLKDGDLAVTTDYRSVLGEILAKRLGVSISDVFPGFVSSPVGVMA